MSRFLHHSISLTCFALLAASCRPSAPAAGKQEAAPLATVADRQITEADLIEEAEWRIKNRQAVPPAGELLKEMVDRLSLVERARAASLETEPDTRRRIESLLIARLREQEIDPALSALLVTEDEVRAAYDARVGQYTLKAMDRFSILYQAAPANSSPSRREESRQRLDSALAQLSADPVSGGRGPAANGFGAVAIEFSDDQTSRYRGGDLGWLDEGAELERIPTEILKAGRRLAKGDRSGVLEAPEGFYIIMKTDSRAGGSESYEEVAPALRHELLLEKRRAEEVRFVSESVARANASMNLEAARKVALPTPGKVPGGPDTPPAFPGVSAN